MTTPPKEFSLDEAADAFFNNNCLVHADDADLAYKNFKAGAAYQAGVEERRAQVLVEALEKLIVNEHVFFLDAKIRDKFMKEVDQLLSNWKGRIDE